MGKMMEVTVYAQISYTTTVEAWDCDEAQDEAHEQFLHRLNGSFDILGDPEYEVNDGGDEENYD